VQAGDQARAEESNTGVVTADVKLEPQRDTVRIICGESSLGRGNMTNPPDLHFRLASIQEDPSNLRVNGGSRGHFVV